MDELPDDATLDDLMYKLYVIECIEQGLAASREGQVIDVEEVREPWNWDTTPVLLGRLFALLLDVFTNHSDRSTTAAPDDGALGSCGDTLL